MKYSEYVTVVKSNSGAILNKVFMRVLLRKAPFLAFGPMNFLATQFVAWLVGEGIDEAEMRIFFVAMDLDSSAEGRQLKNIMIQNHSIQKIGTPDEKKAIEAQLEESLNKFVNLAR